MCYEIERLYWLQRAEQLRREKAAAENPAKNDRATVPAKPGETETGVEQPQPLPV